jgi:hypothetical protein
MYRRISQRYKLCIKFDTELCIELKTNLRSAIPNNRSSFGFESDQSLNEKNSEFDLNRDFSNTINTIFNIL